MKLHTRRAYPELALVILAALLLAPAGVRAAAVPVARDGESAPDGNGLYGSFTNFGDPCLNDAGQVAFSARLTGTAGGTADDEVIVRARDGAPDTSIVREGEALPIGGAFAGGLHFVTRQYVMNNGGRVAFAANLSGTPGGTTDNAGMYSSAGPGTLIQHARKGDLAPGFTMPFAAFFPPQINNQVPANVSFFAGVGSTGPGAIYVAAATSLTRLAYGGQPMPDGNGSIRQFFDTDPPALRPNADEVAVMAWLWSNNGALDDGGLLKARAGGLTIVARGGNPAPGGGTYNDPNGPVMNIMGNAAFRATRYPTPSAGEGIYLASGTVGGSSLIASTGQPAPDRNGTFSGFWHPSLSAGNLVAFRADLTGTAGGGLDDSGIYRGDTLILIQVARENQAVPEGGGRFASFGNVVGINAAGQVLFTANLRETPGGPSDDRGLYLWDEVSGLCKVLREGDVIDGRTVLAFSTLTARDFGGYRCLNDAGQAVARVDLSGIGGDGIYLLSCSATAAIEPLAAPGAAGRLAVAPNPAPGAVLLTYSLPGASGRNPMQVTVHDVAGRLVRSLFAGEGSVSGTLVWDGTGDGGQSLARGVYFLRLTTPGGTMVRRIVRTGS